MRKSISRFFGVLMAMAALASPSVVSAGHHSSSEDSIKTIKAKHVAGTYQISGFSNSLDGSGTALQPQSQGIVGQAVFYSDGTGILPFVDLVPIIGNNIVDVHQENVQFTWTLGPINGYGTVTLQNFPGPGLFPTFAVSFKLHHGHVSGFSLLTTSNNIPTARWTLIQGDRFY
ncbi:MAG: hypothetical protein ACXU9U_03155 [Parachlamydiaceae bacterium]